jgi:hypothetical protein
MYRDPFSELSLDYKDYVNSMGCGSWKSCLQWCSWYMNQLYPEKGMWSLVGKNPKDMGLLGKHNITNGKNHFFINQALNTLLPICSNWI